MCRSIYLMGGLSRGKPVTLARFSMRTIGCGAFAQARRVPRSNNSAGAEKLAADSDVPMSGTDGWLFAAVIHPQYCLGEYLPVDCLLKCTLLKPVFKVKQVG